jgi:hypothetical protein
MGITDKRIEEQDLSSAPLTLEARDGEALEIAGFAVGGADSDSLGTLTIREETMLAFPADDGDDELLLEESLRDRSETFLTRLRDGGFSVPTIKIPEGQELTLDTTTSSGTATVIYDERSADAFGADAEGAPGNKQRTFVSHGRTTQNIGAGATEVVELETSVNPNTLDSFPFGEDAPSGFEFDLQALAVELDDDADADHTLDNVRLNTKETDFLSRESDRVDNGFFEYPDVDLSTHPFLFPDPPTFTPGQDLDIEVEVTDTASSAADTEVNATAVFYRRQPGGGA